MLTQIELRHFKCFRQLKLPLRPLTLLAGSNASGKSSVIQAIVLLHQTMREHEWSARLMLNGSVIRLGTVVDVIDQVYGRRSCSITLKDGDEDWFAWEFEGKRNEMSMGVKGIRGATGAGEPWEVDPSSVAQFHYLLPREVSEHSLTARLRRLTYLTAERIGPRETYPHDDPQLTPVVGPTGEYAVSLLHIGRDRGVLSGLAIHGIPSTRFRQVEACMSRFFPGCVLKVAQVPGANAATLGIRISEETDFLRPTHTGFGITQVLPLVVAALSSETGGLLLIENPEVHLHPAGQASMGHFLAKAAAAGAQIILETHSDHVLNGVRRAVKESLLLSESVALHFFQPRTADMELPQVQSPVLDDTGGIDHWPDGFFDQFDKDMNYFAGWE
ncbi:MAG: DUF3696 domain-containing protein [Gammaproteobacteria bacterium]|nr:DUF3696 domain-containing protein [Gammaproteobacteria bacterium]